MDSNTEQHAQSSHSLCEEVPPPTSEDITDETERALTAAEEDEYGDWIKSPKYYQDKLESHYSLLMCGNITNAGPTQTHSE